MENYLIQLLEENNRVIVPELGAFIIRQNEPKELVFNDLLAFDDGMLTDHIMQVEKMPRSEAQNRIKQFLAKVKTALDADGSCELENLGILRVDESSRIEFIISGAVPKKDKDEKKQGPVTEDTDTAKVEKEKEKGKDKQKVDDTKDTGESGTKDKDKSKNKEKEIVKPKPVIQLTETKSKEPETGPVDETADETDQDEPETGPVDETIDEEGSEEAGKKMVGDDENFLLDESDADVEIDATTEEAQLKPDLEEPPFQIEDAEEGELSEVISKPSSVDSERDFESALAADEPEGDSEEELADEKKDSERKALEEEVETTEEPAEAHEKDDIKADTMGTGEEMVTEEKPKPQRRVLTSELNPEPPLTYTSESSSRKRIWPRIAGMAALIVVLLIIAWFLFPEQVDRILNRQQMEASYKQPVQSGSDQTSSGSETEPEDFAGDQQVGADEPETTVQESLQENGFAASNGQSVEKKYYIVAGSFANLGNAENYVRKLRDMGFNASIFGVRNNLHSVCFNSFPTKQDALRELDRIRENYNGEAWILYY